MMPQQWPPDYKAEIERRMRKRNRYLEDEDLRAKMMVWYAHNPHDWIMDWCVTFDPRAVKPNPRLMPFVLFQRQEEFIDFLMDCYTGKESGLVEKCRDVGATWLGCCFSVWLWLFHPGSVIGWGSNLASNVDKKGNPKAIFTKIRQIIEYLPSWMKPIGYNPAEHALTMLVINPENGSSIIGEGGDNMGRSGRTTIYFKDESAHYQHPEAIEAALGDNTDVQIDISSVKGSGNVFYHRRMAGELWLPDKPLVPGKTSVFIFDWRDHPAKTQAWYDLRRKKAEAEGMLHILAQEVDRDYLASKDKIIIPASWVRAAVDAHIKLNFTPTGAKVCGHDVADGGADKNADVIVHGVVMVFADHWSGDGGEGARISARNCIEQGANELYYDSIGVGSSFKTEINTMRKEGTLPASIKVYPWNAGASVLDPEKNIIPGDKQSPKNKDYYKNLKAQAWFKARTRFYKTYQAVANGKQYDPGEMISLSSQMPLLHQLQAELSQATYDTDNQGKVVVDKLGDGESSPNLADAAVIAYCPIKPAKGFFDV